MGPFRKPSLKDKDEPPPPSRRGSGNAARGRRPRNAAPGLPRSQDRAGVNVVSYSHEWFSNTANRGSRGRGSRGRRGYCGSRGRGFEGSLPDFQNEQPSLSLYSSRNQPENTVVPPVEAGPLFGGVNRPRFEKKYDSDTEEETEINTTCIVQERSHATSPSAPGPSQPKKRAQRRDEDRRLEQLKLNENMVITTQMLKDGCFRDVSISRPSTLSQAKDHNNSKIPQPGPTNSDQMPVQKDQNCLPPGPSNWYQRQSRNGQTTSQPGPSNRNQYSGQNSQNTPQLQTLGLNQSWGQTNHNTSPPGTSNQSRGQCNQTAPQAVTLNISQNESNQNHPVLKPSSWSQISGQNHSVINASPYLARMLAGPEADRSLQQWQQFLNSGETVQLVYVVDTTDARLEYRISAPRAAEVVTTESPPTSPSVSPPTQEDPEEDIAWIDPQYHYLVEAVLEDDETPSPAVPNAEPNLVIPLSESAPSTPDPEDRVLVIDENVQNQEHHGQFSNLAEEFNDPELKRRSVIVCPNIKIEAPEPASSSQQMDDEHMEVKNFPRFRADHEVSSMAFHSSPNQIQSLGSAQHFQYTSQETPLNNPTFSNQSSTTQCAECAMGMPCPRMPENYCPSTGNRNYQMLTYPGKSAIHGTLVDQQSLITQFGGATTRPVNPDVMILNGEIVSGAGGSNIPTQPHTLEEEETGLTIIRMTEGLHLTPLSQMSVDSRGRKRRSTEKDEGYASNHSAGTPAPMARPNDLAQPGYLPNGPETTIGVPGVGSQAHNHLEATRINVSHDTRQETAEVTLEPGQNAFGNDGFQNGQQPKNLQKYAHQQHGTNTNPQEDTLPNFHTSEAQRERVRARFRQSHCSSERESQSVTEEYGTIEQLHPQLPPNQVLTFNGPIISAPVNWVPDPVSRSGRPARHVVKYVLSNTAPYLPQSDLPLNSGLDHQPPQNLVSSTAQCIPQSNKSQNSSRQQPILLNAATSTSQQLPQINATRKSGSSRRKSPSAISTTPQHHLPQGNASQDSGTQQLMVPNVTTRIPQCLQNSSVSPNSGPQQSMPKNAVSSTTQYLQNSNAYQHSAPQCQMNQYPASNSAHYLIQRNTLQNSATPAPTTIQYKPQSTSSQNYATQYRMLEPPASSATIPYVQQNLVAQSYGPRYKIPTNSATSTMRNVAQNSVFQNDSLQNSLSQTPAPLHSVPQSGSQYYSPQYHVRNPALASTDQHIPQYMLPQNRSNQYRMIQTSSTAVQYHPQNYALPYPMPARTLAAQVVANMPRNRLTQNYPAQTFPNNRTQDVGSALAEYISQNISGQDHDSPHPMPFQTSTARVVANMPDNRLTQNYTAQTLPNNTSQDAGSNPRVTPIFIPQINWGQNYAPQNRPQFQTTAPNVIQYAPNQPNVSTPQRLHNNGTPNFAGSTKVSYTPKCSWLEYHIKQEENRVSHHNMTQPMPSSYLRQPAQNSTYAPSPIRNRRRALRPRPTKREIEVITLRGSSDGEDIPAIPRQRVTDAPQQLLQSSYGHHFRVPALPYNIDHQNKGSQQNSNQGSIQELQQRFPYTDFSRVAGHGETPSPYWTGNGQPNAVYLAQPAAPSRSSELARPGTAVAWQGTNQSQPAAASRSAELTRPGTAVAWQGMNPSQPATASWSSELARPGSAVAWQGTNQSQPAAASRSSELERSGTAVAWQDMNQSQPAAASKSSELARSGTAVAWQGTNQSPGGPMARAAITRSEQAVSRIPRGPTSSLATAETEYFGLGQNLYRYNSNSFFLMSGGEGRLVVDETEFPHDMDMRGGSNPGFLSNSSQPMEPTALRDSRAASVLPVSSSQASVLNQPLTMANVRVKAEAMDQPNPGTSDQVLDLRKPTPPRGGGAGGGGGEAFNLD